MISVNDDVECVTLYSARVNLRVCSQVVSNAATGETLLCLCYLFEVSSSEHGSQYHIYKLVSENS